MASYPTEHREDALELRGDGYVDLFEIEFTSGSFIYLTAGDEVTWQGDTYQSHPIKLEGFKQSSDEEVSRPTLLIGNPENVYSAFVRDGVFDNAKVTRYRVLRQHIDADQDIKQTHSWRVRHVPTMRDERITLQLRAQIDGQHFKVPGRMFIPPEFPQVSLG